MPITVVPQQVQSLFVAGQEGYHTFRIPALACSQAGTLLAFAEGRRHSVRDFGEIDLVLRRSVDGGRSFEPISRVVSQAAMTCGNPAIVVDERTARVHLLYCTNPADQPEKAVFEGRAERRVWICHSDDDARTFSEARDITDQVRREDFTWYATGPGRGVCLANGRLLVPCDHARGVARTHDDPVYSHVICSDDGGCSWYLGGIIDTPRSSECGVVRLEKNRVYLDFRNDEPPHTRGGAWSDDGGHTFASVQLQETLPDPGCRAGICGNEQWILVSHPRAVKRERLVLEASLDGGHSFKHVFELTPGPAAYSDLVMLDNTRVACAFETGDQGAYERIDIALLDVS